MKLSMRLLLAFLCILYFYVSHIYYYEQYQQYEVYSSAETMRNFHARQRHVKLQINSINAGNYLKKVNSASNWLYSAIQDDIGTYLGLADLAYLKKAIDPSSFQFTIKDFFFFQFSVIALAIICFFLPIVRIRLSIAAFLSLVIAQFSGDIDWTSSNQSYACVAIVLASVLALSLFDIFRNKTVSWFSVLQVVFCAFYLGYLGLCRSDAKYYASAIVFPLSFFLFTTIIVLFLNKENRALIRNACVPLSARSLVRALWSLYTVRLLAGCLLVLFSVIVPVRIALYLNQAFFEHLEKIPIESDNVSGGHVFWQPMYMGLGATHKSISDRVMDPWNHENVVYSETGAAAHAWIADTNDENLLWKRQGNIAPLVSAWKPLFFSCLLNNPIDYMRSYYSKIVPIYVKNETLHILCLVVFLFCVGVTIANPFEFYSSIAIQTVFISLLVMAAIPGILMSASFDGSFASEPVYLSGYRTALVSYPMMMMALVTIRRKWPVSDAFKVSVYRPALSVYLVGVLSLILLLAISVSGFLGWKQSVVFDLQRNVVSSSADLDSLFRGAYHADLVRAINGLPEESKNAVIERMKTAPVGDPVTLVNLNNGGKTDDIKIEGVKKVEDHFFFILKTLKEVRNTVIPLNIKDPSLKINGLVVLPPRLRPGQWLFSVRVGSGKDVVRILHSIVMTKYNIYESKDSSPATIGEVFFYPSLSDTIAPVASIVDLYPLREAAEKNEQTRRVFQEKEQEILNRPSQLRVPLVKGIELVDFKWERLVSKQPGDMPVFEGSFLLRVNDQPDLAQYKEISLPLYFLADEKYRELFTKMGTQFPSFGLSLRNLPFQYWKKGDYYLAKRPYAVPDVPYKLKMGLSGDNKLISPWVDLGQHPGTPTP